MRPIAMLAVGGLFAAVSCTFALKRLLRVPVHQRPRLGLLERWYSSFRMPRRVTAAVFKWTKDRKATKALFVDMRRRFPTLASVVTDGEWAASTTPFEVEEYDEAWERVCERLMSEDMYSSARLLRVAISKPDQTLVIMLDHCLTDGMGLAGFVRALFDGESDQIVIPAPLEQHVDITARIGMVLKRLWDDFTQDSCYVGPLFVGNERDEVDQTLMDSLRIDASKLKALSTRAKAKGTSVHGVLCAASVIALASLNPEEISKRNFAMDTPMSLRHLGPFQKVLGNYVSNAAVSVVPGKWTDTWALAKHFKVEIERQRPTAPYLVGQYILLNDFRAFSEKMENEAPLGRKGTMEVSNLGRTEMASDIEWAFSQGNHYIGPLLIVNAVAPENNGVPTALWLTFTARSLCMNRPALGAFKEALTTTLDGLIAK